MGLMNMLLELPGVGKVRRVHALEHATITILSRRVRDLSLVGRSTPRGFWIYGEVDSDALRAAADEALRRLQGGEATLAIHPRCGTNLAVAGLLTGASGFLASLAMHEDERLIDRLPRAILAATAAMFVAQPMGLAVQEQVTTSPDAARLSIGEIRQSRRGGMTVTFVEVPG